MSESEPAVRPRRILIVDDNRDAADLLVTALELSGHAVAVAYDAEGALARVSEFRPDAVVIDIGLPGTDGYELANRLRERTTEPLLLIAVTGYGDETARAASARAGFSRHMVKPVDLDDLIAALAKPS